MQCLYSRCTWWTRSFGYSGRRLSWWNHTGVHGGIYRNTNHMDPDWSKNLHQFSRLPVDCKVLQRFSLWFYLTNSCLLLCSLRHVQFKTKIRFFLALVSSWSNWQNADRFLRDSLKSLYYFETNLIKILQDDFYNLNFSIKI